MTRLPTIAILLALAACAGPGHRGPPPEAGGRSIEALADRLGLTEKQQIAVWRILSEDRARIEAARAESHRTMLADLGAVLTPGQLAEFEQAMLEGLPGEGPEGAGPGGDDGRSRPPPR